MIDAIFNEVIEEARKGVVNLVDGDDILPIRIRFNFVEDTVSNEMPNIYIKDKNKFKQVLFEYVNIVLEFYSLQVDYNTIKRIIAYSFVNISPDEMDSFEDYLLKYIGFYKSKFVNISGSVNTSIGTINYGISKQSLKQETPYCFKSYISENDSIYSLPRISFGLNNGVCEIYAIQNKDIKMNVDDSYAIKVHKTFATINKGVSKYRNVTPSFVITLILFVSLLKENGIEKIKLITPLPIRSDSRLESMKVKIKFASMKCELTSDSIESVIKAIQEKTNRDNYNSTIKFVNCFNRLNYCFEDIHFSQIDNEALIGTLKLSIDNEFLNEILKKEMDDNGKISKHCSC